MLKKLLLFLPLVTLMALAQKAHEIGFITINDAYFTTDKYFSASNGFYYRPKNSTFTFTTAIEIYTPRRMDLDLKQPPKGIHPYGGLLYAQVDYKTLIQEKFLLSLTAQAGTTGKASLAQDFQDTWHTIINRPLHQGWDTQIASRVALQGTLRVGHITRFDDGMFLKELALNAGNLRVSQTATLSWYNNPSINETLLYAHKYDTFKMFHHISIKLSHIQRDVFLTGFDSDYAYGVAIQPLVAMATVGYDFLYKHFGIRYDLHFQSKNFVTQNSGHYFANITLFTRF